MLVLNMIINVVEESKAYKTIEVPFLCVMALDRDGEDVKVVNMAIIEVMKSTPESEPQLFYRGLSGSFVNYDNLKIHYHSEFRKQDLDALRDYIIKQCKMDM